MGVDVSLVRITGRTHKNKRGDVGHVEWIEVYSDECDAFANACYGTDLAMLCRVKPYGSLKLKPDDMAQFIREVNRLAGSDDVPYREPIIDLAERCARTPDTELHLDGD